MSVRQIVMEPTGRQRIVLKRVAEAKHMADQILQSAILAQARAGERLADVLESLTGEDAKGLIIDEKTLQVYREVTAAPVASDCPTKEPTP